MSIFDVRLRISDPAGFIAFVEVATTALLPAAPANQTAYKVTADGNYYATDKTSGATPADYEIQELLISDARIQNWITLNGEDYATCQAINAIKPQLLQKMQLVRIVDGADSTQYQTLKDTYEYLKALGEECKEESRTNAGNNTGKIGAMKVPEVAGGAV